MKEITRIHIAKTPYDIEIVAKNELELYVKSLESFTDGQDWISDIEIRITELLLERGIKKNDVVSLDDINAIKVQLGSPEDFTQDTDEMIDSRESSTLRSEGSRLYRDLDGAALGGVLSGIAKYFDINPVWVRLLFIILLLVSFGTVSIVYLVMWLSIPAAKTAAEKLQQEGKPITLSSMKDLRSRAGDTPAISRAAKFSQSMVIYGLGTLAGMGAVASILITAVSGFILGVSLSDNNNPLLGSFMPYESWEMWLAYALFITSGLLLTALFSLIAISFFRKHLSKTIGIALIAITISGVATFGLGVTSMIYGAYQQDNFIASSEKIETHDLPSGFKDITKLDLSTLKINPSNTPYNVEYVVDTNRQRYELHTNVTTASIKPNFKISEDGKTATMSVEVKPENQNRSYNHSYPTIKIYGPRLDSIKADKSTITYTNGQSQDNLSIDASDANMIIYGKYNSVSAKVSNHGIATLSSATIENLITDVTQGSLNAGVVRNFSATQSEICPAESYSRSSDIDIKSVTSGKISINGKQSKATDINTACSKIDIDDDYDNDFDDDSDD